MAHEAIAASIRPVSLHALRAAIAHPPECATCCRGNKGVDDLDTPGIRNDTGRMPWAPASFLELDLIRYE